MPLIKDSLSSASKVGRIGQSSNLLITYLVKIQEFLEQNENILEVFDEPF
jgi:hypothetical protein